MNLNFKSIFEALNYGRESALIHLSEDGIEIEDKWQYSVTTRSLIRPSKQRLAKIQAQNQTTWGIFKSLVKKEIAPFQSDETHALIKELKSRSKEKNSLNARFVRECYRRIIATKLSGFRKLAAIASDNETIVWDKNLSNFLIKKKPTRQENEHSWDALLESLYEDWGKPRVDPVLKRYHLRKNRSSPLLTKDINHLIAGIADYQKSNLLACFERFKQLCQKIDTNIPLYEKNKLKKRFQIENDSDLKMKITEIYGGFIDASFDELPKKLQNIITSAVFLNQEELNLAFQGRRVEGIIDGSLHTVKGFFLHNVISLDIDRLHLYEKIFDASKNLPETQFDLFFDEILAKTLVKKEMEEKTWIPSPWRSKKDDFKFYEISKTILTRKSKLSYFLQSNSKRLKDRLVYRSTSSSPSTTDSLSTIITDIFPFGPPAYLWKKAGHDEEREIFFKNSKKLRIIGHSLGGSHGQIALLNHTIDKDESALNFPFRKIELITFDSPKISYKSSLNFANWLNDEANQAYWNLFKIEHYTSKGDPVPKSGEAYLGQMVKAGRLKNFKIIKLLPKSTPSLRKKHPHNRQFFRYLEGENFEQKDKSSKIPSQKWHILELIRRIAGFFLFPVFWIVWKVKQVIYAKLGVTRRTLKPATLS